MVTSIVPEKFDSGDFVTWLRQFKVCASANSYDEAKKLKFLASFLCGPAATYFHSLDEDQRDSYAHLSESLTQHMCPAVYRERCYADFESRTLRPSEDPSLLL